MPAIILPIGAMKGGFYFALPSTAIFIVGIYSKCANDITLIFLITWSPAIMSICCYVRKRVSVYRKDYGIFTEELVNGIIFKQAVKVLSGQTGFIQREYRMVLTWGVVFFTLI